MSVTITWLPNIEEDIARYEIQRAPDDAGQPGTWVDLTSITHDLNGPNYNSSINRFYLIDETGSLNHWYRLRSIDSSENASDYSIAFQPSEATAPPTFPNTVALYEHYGEENALQITDIDGNPLDAVQIRVYRKIDYDLHNYDTIIGQTLSTLQGGWQAAIFVEAGLTYTIHCFKPNTYNPKTYEITVP